MELTGVKGGVGLPKCLMLAEYREGIQISQAPCSSATSTASAFKPPVLHHKILT